MLSIVTASHRNLSGLTALGEQVRPLLASGEVSWVVKDSGAEPAIRSWADGFGSPGFTFDDCPDTGIYDALNQAIAYVRTPYYLVFGSDDGLDPEAIRQIVALLQGFGTRAGAPDILTFPVRTGALVRRRRRVWPLALGSSGLTSSHSVGTVIRTGLHATLGLYDIRYSLLADSLFLRRARLAHAVFAHFRAPVPGHFSLEGVSSTRIALRIRETYSYLVESGSSPVVQGLLLCIRICKFRPGNLL